MAINPGPCGCLRQLSTIKCYFTILSEEISIQLFHPICKISKYIQLFICAFYIHGEGITFLKHLRFLAFQMTSTGSLSPAEFSALIPVSLTFLYLPPGHFHLSIQEYYLVGLGRNNQTHQRWRYPAICTLIVSIVGAFRSSAQSCLVWIILVHSILF